MGEKKQAIKGAGVEATDSADDEATVAGDDITHTEIGEATDSSDKEYSSDSSDVS